MKRKTVSFDDLLTKATGLPKVEPLSKNILKGATDFIRKNNQPNKLETKGRQTGDKLKTNRRRTKDKVETITPSTSRPFQETRDKVGTQPETQLETKWRQTEDKVETNPDPSELIGLQRRLLLFMFDSCQMNASENTSKITIESLSTRLQVPKNSIKKTIQRIEKKGFITRLKFKNGRGGWTIYKLENRVYSNILQSETRDKVRTNWRQSRDEVGTQPETEPETTSSSSSGDLTFKKITTTTVDNLIESISEISIPLALTQIGFRASQIKQILGKGVLSKKDIEESLEHFSYALEKKLIHAHTGPLNFLMGILIKKEVPYVCEQYVAELRTEKESIKKLQEEYRSFQKQESREVLVIKFEEYKKGLTKTEIDKIIPPNDIVKSGSDRQGILLKAHFEEKVV